MNYQSFNRDGPGDKENFGHHKHTNGIETGVSSYQDTNYEELIKELQKQLDTNVTELTDLRQRVKDFEFQLEKKCDEVKNLKQRINELEEEKRTLQEELTGDEENLGHVHDTNYEQDIKELQTQLDTKETKLTDLNKRVKEIEKKQNDLEFQLEKKCDEVKDLKQRTDELEEEKRTLQEELTSVKFTLKITKEEVQKLNDQKLKEALAEKNDVKVELKTLKTLLKTKHHQNSELQKTNEKLKNDELQKRIETLEKENERLSVKIKTLETDIEMLKSEMKEQKEENRKRVHELEYKNEKLEGKNQNLNENLQRIELDLKTVKQLEITKPIEQSKASLYLGELCWQIQSLIYQIVMPQYHLPKRSYKAKNIVKDIKKWTKTPDEEKEANEKWQELKSILNWNEEQEEAVRALQESRNAEAHPPLDEIDLRESAKVIEREGIYSTDLLSLDLVNKLIDILVKLRQMTKDKPI